jgi:hypothetical protein
MSLTRQETVFEMMAGRLPASALDAFDKPAAVTDSRSTRPDLGSSKSWASQGDHKRGPTTFRDGRAVPEWVLKAEAAGEKYFYVEQGEFHGWAKPRPEKTPDALLSRMKQTGERWAWDFSRGAYRPLADIYSPIPPAMAETCEKHGITPTDPRYPVLDMQTGHWSWGEQDAGKGRRYGPPVERPDLGGLDYWNDQEQFGIVRPGGGVEKYGARQSDDGAGSLHNPENSISAEQAAAQPGLRAGERAGRGRATGGTE